MQHDLVNQHVRNIQVHNDSLEKNIQEIPK